MSRVSDNASKSRYELTVGGERVGLIAYRADGDTVDLLHTEIDPEHQGQGLGSELVAGALEDIEARGLQVKPSCSFVAAYVRGHSGSGNTT